jgi:signal transduction histidine kinase
MQNPILAPNERTIYQQFDHDQRVNFVRRLTTLGIPASIIVLAAVGFGLQLSHQGSLAAAALVAAALFPLALGLALFFIQRGRLRVAISLIVSSAFIVSFILHLIAVINTPYNTGLILLMFALYQLVVTLAGLLGSRPLIVIMALASAIATSIIVALLPDYYPILFIAIFSLGQLLAMSAMLYVFAGSITSTLERLGLVQVLYERSRKLDDLKDQFIASVNHELRTPIMALQGFIELYLMSEGLPQDDRDALIAEAREVTDNLTSLLQSILDVRRIDQGANDFTPVPVNVREALTASLHLIDPREAKSTERDLRIDIPSDLNVMGEPTRLQQVFTNLLSNAIKYSDPGSAIEVAGRVVPIANSSSRSGMQAAVVEITVRDYGLGVPPDQAPLLFQRFARLSRDLASTVNGNGLGLYLCRVFVESMGGTIRLDSPGIPGLGTVFTIHLRLPSGDALRAIKSISAASHTRVGK